MPSEIRFGKFWAGYFGISVILGVLVLFVSLVITGLYRTLTLNGGQEDSSHVVAFEENTADGGQEEIEYRLPQPGVTPGEWLYPLKEIRNKLWQAVVRDDYSQAKLQLILANKKLAEIQELSGKEDAQSKRLALKCGEEAFKALKYADEIVGRQTAVDQKWQQLHLNIYMAGRAYRSSCEDETSGTNKQIIEEWLEKQKTETSLVVAK
jgi:flagellar basal body-associated protein FliL